jgi:digeranylgeranylglycerophospholipid reductase
MATSGGGIPFAMVSGKIAGETAADFIRGDCQLGDYEHRWREQIGKELNVSLSVRRLVDSLMRSDKLMNAVMRLLTGEQLEDLQKGTMSEATKKILTGIYRTSH